MAGSLTGDSAVPSAGSREGAEVRATFVGWLYPAPPRSQRRATFWRQQRPPPRPFSPSFLAAPWRHAPCRDGAHASTKWSSLSTHIWGSGQQGSFR